MMQAAVQSATSVPVPNKLTLRRRLLAYLNAYWKALIGEILFRTARHGTI